MNVLTDPTFVLFAVLFAGMALGNIQVKGVSLGSSGVLFVALLAGHFQLTVPEGLSDIGTALFVYCVGLGVGNRFFASLRSKGSRLVLLSVLVVGLAWATAVVLCRLVGVNAMIATGLFAGACTSTPALAAGMEAAKGAGMDPAVLNIGYGVAYPFGVIGVVLFVQLLPRLLKQNIDEAPSPALGGKDPHKIISRVVDVTHPDVMGRNIQQYVRESHMLCRITRVVRDDLLHPLQPGDVFEEGSEVLMVGEREQVMHDALLLGHMDERRQHPRTFGDETAELIVLSQSMCNKTLSELDTLGNYGIVVSRVTRLGATFVPTADTEIIRNDVLKVVGTPKAIAAFKQACGHRCSAINATDILSLTGGVVLGILVGRINFSLGDGPGFSLGMAGGPLVVALILGHFGKLGPIAGYMPRPARVLVMELALMLFLAGAGVKGGSALVETLQQYGLTMFLVGVAITLVPLVGAYVVARKVLRMPLPESLGGICGSMTSTPALGAITAKTDRQEPVIAYSTAYPAALILMTILAKAVLSLV